MKPIYKRKWFLIGVGVAAFMVIGIISNLGESEEPAPGSTAMPAPIATPIPTPTRVPIILSPTPTILEKASADFDRDIAQLVYLKDDWLPTDSDFVDFCVQLGEGEFLTRKTKDIGIAFNMAAAEAGMTLDEKAQTARDWCDNR